MIIKDRKAVIDDVYNKTMNHLYKESFLVLDIDKHSSLCNSCDHMKRISAYVDGFVDMVISYLIQGTTPTRLYDCIASYNVLRGLKTAMEREITLCVLNTIYNEYLQEELVSEVLGALYDDYHEFEVDK